MKKASVQVICAMEQMLLDVMFNEYDLGKWYGNGEYCFWEQRMEVDIPCQLKPDGFALIPFKEYEDVRDSDRRLRPSSLRDAISVGNILID